MLFPINHTACNPYPIFSEITICRAKNTQILRFFCLNFLGVVHLASTESTGGSTTGDDEESSDAAQGQGGAVDKVLLETRRNTYQNESIANSYRQVSSLWFESTEYILKTCFHWIKTFFNIINIYIGKQAVTIGVIHFYIKDLRWCCKHILAVFPHF